MAFVKKRETAKGPRYDVFWRDPSGKQKQKAFTRKLDADRFSNNVESKKDEGLYVDPQLARQTFNTYADKWLKDYAGKRRSWQVRDRHLRLHIKPHIGDMAIGQITPSTVRGLMKKLSGLDANYQRQIYSTLHTVFRSAADDGVLGRVPTNTLSSARPKRVKKEKSAWPLEWVTGVHEHLPEQYKIVVALGVGLGLRIGEICGLSPDDIDFIRDEVRVSRQVVKDQGGRWVFAPPKAREDGETVRVIPLPADVRLELATHMKRHQPARVTLPWKAGDATETHTAHLLLSNKNGEVVRPIVFSEKTWNPARRKAGIPDSPENGVHALRHLYGSTLIENGVSFAQVSANMGHKSPSTTLDVYVHVMPQGVERTKETMSGFFEKLRHVEGSQATEAAQEGQEEPS